MVLSIGLRGVLGPLVKNHCVVSLKQRLPLTLSSLHCKWRTTCLCPYSSSPSLTHVPMLYYSPRWDLRQVTLHFSLSLLLPCLFVLITGFASDSLSVLVTGAAVRQMKELSEFALAIRNGQLHPSYGFSPSVPELFTLNSGPLTLLGQVLACLW